MKISQIWTKRKTAKQIKSTLPFCVDGAIRANYCLDFSDNLPYEKVGKNEPVCIADEVPFDIPESWEWTRIGNVFQINPRNNLPDELETGFVPMALLSDGFCSRHSYEPKKWKDIKNGFTHFANNDIVIAKITPCFQNRKSAVVTGLPNGFGAGTTELHVLRDNTKELFMPYFLLICKTQAFIQDGVKNFSGTAAYRKRFHLKIFDSSSACFGTRTDCSKITSARTIADFLRKCL